MIDDDTHLTIGSLLFNGICHQRRGFHGIPAL